MNEKLFKYLMLAVQLYGELGPFIAETIKNANQDKEFTPEQTEALKNRIAAHKLDPAWVPD